MGSSIAFVFGFKYNICVLGSCTAFLCFGVKYNMCVLGRRKALVGDQPRARIVASQCVVFESSSPSASRSNRRVQRVDLEAVRRSATTRAPTRAHVQAAAIAVLPRPPLENWLRRIIIHTSGAKNENEKSIRLTVEPTPSPTGTLLKNRVPH